MNAMNPHLQDLLDEVRQTQRETLRQANLLAKVRAGVEAASVGRPFISRGRGFLILATAGGAAALAFTLLRPAPLSVAIGDPSHPAKVGAGAVIEAPATAQLPLRFGDGTALALAPQA